MLGYVILLKSVYPTLDRRHSFLAVSWPTCGRSLACVCINVARKYQNRLATEQSKYSILKEMQKNNSNYKTN